jgi:hypothetical protein
MTLQLADASVRLPMGVVEDVPVQVGKFFVPGDFVVMEMEEDRDVPIILGRPFLRTARTVFDTYEGTLTMKIEGEEVKFQIAEAMKYPDTPYDCHRIDVIDECVYESQVELLEQYQNSISHYTDFLSRLQVELDTIQSVCSVDESAEESDKATGDELSAPVDPTPPLDAVSKPDLKPLPEKSEV